MRLSIHDKKAQKYKQRQHKIDQLLSGYMEADKIFHNTPSALVDLTSQAYEIFRNSQMGRKRQLIDIEKMVHMDGLNSSSNSRDGKLDNGDQKRPLRSRNLSKNSSRPDYEFLWDKALSILSTAPPRPQQHIYAWLAAGAEFCKALADLDGWINVLRLMKKTVLPTSTQSIDAWADAEAALGKVVLRLFHPDLTPTGATKNIEQILNEEALAKTHDFLKLYAEVIKQPPPDDLVMIEQVLRHRRDTLQSLRPSSPQP